MSRHALTLSVSVSGAMYNHIYVDVQPATAIINNTLLQPQMIFPGLTALTYHDPY